jgi:hypothetical protein
MPRWFRDQPARAALAVVGAIWVLAAWCWKSRRSIEPPRCADATEASKGSGVLAPRPFSAHTMTKSRWVEANVPNLLEADGEPIEPLERCPGGACRGHQYRRLRT